MIFFLNKLIIFFFFISVQAKIFPVPDIFYQLLEELVVQDKKRLDNDWKAEQNRAASESRNADVSVLHVLSRANCNANVSNLIKSIQESQYGSRKFEQKKLLEELAGYQITYYTSSTTTANENLSIHTLALALSLQLYASSNNGASDRRSNGGAAKEKKRKANKMEEASINPSVAKRTNNTELSSFSVVDTIINTNELRDQLKNYMNTIVSNDIFNLVKSKNDDGDGSEDINVKVIRLSAFAFEELKGKMDGIVNELSTSASNPNYPQKDLVNFCMKVNAIIATANALSLLTEGDEGPNDYFALHKEDLLKGLLENDKKNCVRILLLMMSLDEERLTYTEDVSDKINEMLVNFLSLSACQDANNNYENINSLKNLIVQLARDLEPKFKENATDKKDTLERSSDKTESFNKLRDILDDMKSHKLSRNSNASKISEYCLKVSFLFHILFIFSILFSFYILLDPLFIINAF